MAELDDRLRALGPDASWPATPDLAPRVAAAIAARRVPPPLIRRPALVAALLAVLLGGGLVAAPGVRSELLERLGLKHASVTRTKELPPTTLGRTFALGTRLTLDAAGRRAGFRLRRPRVLGSPSAVYVDRGAVTFTFDDADPLLFTQVQGTVRPFIAKFTTGDARRVRVGGAPGLIAEGQHVVIFQPRRGAPRASPSRLAKTSVVWERDGLVLRLEGDRPAAELLRIARSVR